MSNSKTRVGFAATPTGILDVGDARTALFNWLYALKKQGVFVLRIQDIGLSPAEHRHQNLLSDTLRWLGMDWDEGPDKGPHGPYRQSEREELYQGYVKKLTDSGLAYPCYCSKEELKAQQRQMVDTDTPARYAGKCRKLTDAKRRRLEAEGRKPAVRLSAPHRSLCMDDLIRGLEHFDADVIGDFVIVHPSGVPAHDFASAIDDALMDISLAIRGEDHLLDSCRQMLVCDALGFGPPRFAHHALLLGPDRTKLARRHGVRTVEQLTMQGFVPQAVVNYLACVGDESWIAGDILLQDEMIESFDIKKAGKNAGVFDQQKLRQMNAAHLRCLAPETVLEHWYNMGVGRVLRDRDRLLEVVPLVVDNVETLDQLEPLMEIFTEKNVAFSMEAEQSLRSGHGPEVLQTLAKTLEQTEAPRTQVAYQALVRRVEADSGRSGESLFMPIRTALTGETAGPGLDKILCNLDKNTLLHRIKRALDMLIQ